MRRYLLIAAVALIALPAVASAGTVTPGEHDVYGANVYIKTMNHPAYPSIVRATGGLVNWSGMTVVDVPTLGPSFSVFRLDIQTVLDTGTFSFWDDLSTAPVSEDGDTTLEFMQFSDVDLGDKVADLRRLVAGHYHEVMNATTFQNLKLAAFQIAIWEIVYENEKTGSGHGYDVLGGDIFFSTTNRNTMDGMMGFAGDYLATVNSGVGGEHVQLGALVSGTNSDMLVVIAAPTPTAALAGIAVLAGLVTVRRIRRRRLSAI